MALQDVAHSQTQEAVIHHAANAAAVAIPVGAVVINHVDTPAVAFKFAGLVLTAPEWVALCAGILGIIWYAILIGEKVVGWITSVKDKIEGDEDPRDLIQEDHHVQHEASPPSHK